MRQMNGIYQMEQSRYGKAGRGQEIPENNITTDVNKGQDTIEVPSFSYVKSKADAVKTGTIMDNFDEYRKQKLEREKESSVDEEEIRKEQRERARDLAASLSEEEIQMLRVWELMSSLQSFRICRGLSERCVNRITRKN